jgi:hypothetical protein
MQTCRGGVELWECIAAAHEFQRGAPRAVEEHALFGVDPAVSVEVDVTSMMRLLTLLNSERSSMETVVDLASRGPRGEEETRC